MRIGPDGAALIGCTALPGSGSEAYAAESSGLTVMKAIRRILVCVKNPAAKSLPAVTKGAQLAQALQAELCLFQSIALPPYLENEAAYLNDALADAERCTEEVCLAALDGLARRTRRRGIMATVSAQFDYPVYEAVIREAIRLKADLIVAEQHHGHRAASLLHLVDWELLRLSPLPVLLVKDARTYRRPRILAAVDPDHTYAKPVWLDREILTTAREITTALKGALHALHAYPPVPLPVVSSGVLSERRLADVQARSAASATRKLRRTLADAQVRGAEPHVVGRHASDAIVELAEELDAAMVVMGAVARSGFKRLLIGNTAERVLDRLSCDVLVVKPEHLARRVAPPRRSLLRRTERVAPVML